MWFSDFYPPHKGTMHRLYFRAYDSTRSCVLDVCASQYCVKNTISYAVPRMREVALDMKGIMCRLHATKYYCTLPRWSLNQKLLLKNIKSLNLQISYVHVAQFLSACYFHCAKALRTLMSRDSFVLKATHWVEHSPATSRPLFLVCVRVRPGSVLCVRFACVRSRVHFRMYWFPEQAGYLIRAHGLYCWNIRWTQIKFN